MKKNDGGYILPYVLVVMTILSLVAVSIMSNTLRGLQTQQSGIERMQDRYIAEGAVETVTSQMMALKSVSFSDTQDNLDETARAEKFKETFKNTLLGFGNVTFEGVKPSLTGTGFYDETAKAYVFQITAQKGAATISCEVNFSCTVEADETPTEINNGVDKSYDYSYNISNNQITYSTYTVTYS